MGRKPKDWIAAETVPSADSDTPPSDRGAPLDEGAIPEGQVTDGTLKTRLPEPLVTQDTLVGEGPARDADEGTIDLLDGDEDVLFSDPADLTHQDARDDPVGAEPLTDEQPWDPRTAPQDAEFPRAEFTFPGGPPSAAVEPTEDHDGEDWGEELAPNGEPPIHEVSSADFAIEEISSEELAIQGLGMGERPGHGRLDEMVSDGASLDDDEEVFLVQTSDIVRPEPGELAAYPTRADDATVDTGDAAQPLIATRAEQREDDTEPAEPLHVEDGSPFVVTTDELGVLDLLDAGDSLDALIESSTDATATDVPVDARDFEEQPFWEKRRLELQEQLSLARNTRREPEVLAELASVLAEKLREREDAVEIYERLLELVPDHDDAFKALDRLYQLTWETDKLIELLLDRQEYVEAIEQKVELLARVGELYEQTGESDKALVVLEAAQSIDSENARVAAALGRLSQHNPEVTLEQPGAPSPPPPPADPLEQLEARLEVSIADDERVEILEQMAVLWLRRDVPQRAAHCLHEVINLDSRRDSAYRRLQQLYRKHDRYKDLVSVLELHSRALAPEPRIEVLRQLVDLYEGPLVDRATARLTLERIREIAPDDGPTLRALIRHHEEAGDAQGLLALLRDASHRLPHGERVELLYRQGQLLAESLDDPWGAEEHYQQALEIDATHAASITALTEIYRGRGDWGKAVRMTLAAASACSAPAQRARYLFDAATTRLGRLDDEAGATELLSRTLEADPDHHAAAEALGAILFRQGDFARLAPVLDVLLRKTDREDVPRQVDLHHKLAVVARATDDFENALRHFGRALELDPEHQDALLGQGDLAFEREKWRLAYESYGKLWAQLDDISPDVQRRLLFQQAKSATALGDKPQARTCYETLLARAPADTEAMKELSALQLDGSDWHGALTSKEALLERLEGDEAAALLLEIGDLYRDKLRDAEQAEPAYRRALEIKANTAGKKGDDRVLLHRLLDLYSDTKKWSQTVEICERLAQNETEPKVRAKYLGVAASLCEKHLDRVDDALRFYNKVLDVDPEQLKAFSAIDALCTKARDWRALEQNYGKMIKRLPADAKVGLKVMLWHNLGEVLRSRRRDFESAIAAFEVAQQLEPENAHRRKILAELYITCGPDYLEKGIAAYHQLLDENPKDIAGYDKLRKLYLQDGQYDRAWCLSGALTFLQKADREARDLFRRYRRRGLPLAQARLTDDAWVRHVYHPDQDRYLSAIFALLAPAISAMTARPHGQFELKRKERYDFHADPDHPFCRIFAYVQNVLHLPAFDLFLDPERPASLQLAHTSEATSIVAGAHVLKQERHEKEMTFLVAKQLAMLRSDLFLRVALPARAQLQGTFLAALKLVNPKAPVPPGEEKGMAKSVDRLKKALQLPQLDQLAQLIAHVPQPERIDLSAWWNIIELTTDRVAFLLCNDIEVAARAIASEPAAGNLSSRDRTAQLVRFCCSTAYFKLRRDLGLTIEQAT